MLILSHRRSDGPWLDGSELKRARAAGVPPWRHDKVTAPHATALCTVQQLYRHLIIVYNYNFKVNRNTPTGRPQTLTHKAITMILYFRVFTQYGMYKLFIAYNFLSSCRLMCIIRRPHTFSIPQNRSLILQSLSWSTDLSSSDLHLVYINYPLNKYLRFLQFKCYIWIYYLQYTKGVYDRYSF